MEKCPSEGKVSAYDYATSTAPAADGTGGTFEIDLAFNGSYDTRVLGAHSLDIVQQHNTSRGLYLYFAFHAVSQVFSGRLPYSAGVAVADSHSVHLMRAVVPGPRGNECTVGDSAALPQ